MSGNVLNAPRISLQDSNDIVEEVCVMIFLIHGSFLSNENWPQNEFKLAYFDIAVQHVNHNATRTTLLQELDNESFFFQENELVEEKIARSSRMPLQLMIWIRFSLRAPFL